MDEDPMDMAVNRLKSCPRRTAAAAAVAIAAWESLEYRRLLSVAHAGPGSPPAAAGAAEAAVESPRFSGGVSRALGAASTASAAPGRSAVGASSSSSNVRPASGRTASAGTVPVAGESPRPSGGAVSAPPVRGRVAAPAPGAPARAEVPPPSPNPDAPPLARSFDGLNYGESGYIPPDPHGAVGPSHVVSVVNASIAWHTKAGTRQHAGTLASFFAPVTPLTGTFDPKVIFDPNANRFVVVALEKTASPNTSRILVAASDDADPNGTWYYAAVDARQTIGGAESWADYPAVASDARAIYVTANMHAFSDGAFKGARLWILDKTALYANAATPARVFDPQAAAGLTSQGSTLQPAQMFGTAPAGVGTFLTSTGWASGATDFLSVVRVDNPLATAPAFTHQFIDLGDIDAGGAADAPQPGTTARVDTGGGKAINAVWRNNALYLAHTINPVSGPDAGQATAHWYKISTSNLASLSVVDQGNVGAEDRGAGTYTFYPSVAVDAGNNLAIGFAASGPSVLPGAYYTVHLASAPAGSVQPTGTAAAGQDYYSLTFGAGRNRWGDYSATVVDPADGSFWVFNEYATGRTPGGAAGEDGRWGTRWGRFYAAATPPAIDSLSDTPDPAVKPDTVTVFANGVSDPDGAVVSVAFYRGSNNVDGLQTGAGGDTLLGVDTNGADGWSWTFATTGLPAGVSTYYALATDNAGNTSGTGTDAPSTTNTVRDPSPPIVVSTLTDELDADRTAGDLSLREALAMARDAAGRDVINFAPSLAGSINLASSLGELRIDSVVTINGPGADRLTINAGGAGRVFTLAENSTISGLRVTGAAGGAIVSGFESRSTLERLVIEGNAGGLFVPENGIVTAIECRISDNQAGGGGGIGVSGVFTLIRSTVSGNRATGGSQGSGNGGGISASGFATVVIVNSTFSGNSATGDGGGIYVAGTASMSLTNVTVVGNDADSDRNGTGAGGGIYAQTFFLTLRNSIVAANRANPSTGSVPDDVFDEWQTVTPSSNTYNLIGTPKGNLFANGANGNKVGTVAAPLDPRLGLLQDNGGPTPTHAPRGDSPAIDAGSNAAAADAGLTVDQRGFARVVAARGTAAATVDIGAVEVAPIVVSTLTDELDADRSPGDLSLREALAMARDAAGADVIEFAPSLAGVIRLSPTLGELRNELGAVTINGPGADRLTIDAGGASRAFTLSDDTTLSGLRIIGGATSGFAVRVGSDSRCTLERLTIDGNAGGGLFVAGVASVVECRITNNRAFSGGGILVGGVLTLIRSTVSGNRATGGSAGTGHGGGLYVDGVTASATVVNSTFSGNTAVLNGGGIYSRSGSLDLTNVTVTQNESDSDRDGTGTGGGIYAQTGLMTLRNSIVAANRANPSAGSVPDDLFDEFRVASPSSNPNNLIGTNKGNLFVNGANGNKVGTDAAPLDPRLGLLQDNGGPTPTHAPRDDSPAIDAGSNAAAAAAGLTVDQRGLARVVAARGTAATVDIGAVEAGPIAQRPTIGSLTDGPDPVVKPNGVTLTANSVSDPDGAVVSVAFYRGSNNVDGLQTGAGGDTLLGVDTNGADGWSWTFATTGLPAGVSTYYALATDNAGNTSGTGTDAPSTTNTVQDPQPEITVLLGGTALTDGQSTPVDFGSVPLNGAPRELTFTVRNDGTQTLTLSGLSVPAGYSVTRPLPASLAPGASDTFTLRLISAAAGVKSGTVSFANNDGDENPFNFPVTGTVTGSVPQIVIGSNGVLPNRPNQRVFVRVTGVDPVTGFNLRAQLGDGQGPAAEPVFQAVDFTGGIWDGRAFTVSGGPVAAARQYAQASVVFNNAGESVAANGLVVTLVIDTTGFNTVGQSFALRLAGTDIGVDSDFILAGGGALVPSVFNGTIAVENPAAVVGRRIFYNNSYFDGNNTAANAGDDGAIAPDKQALLPGQTATFANYTSFSKGINGIMVDVERLANRSALSAADFAFRVGNAADTATWSPAPAPASVVVRAGAGAGGSDRIELVWADGAIQRQWLRVSMLANANTGLAAPDVFYFGNAVGESGNSPTDTFVDGSDFAGARDDPHNFLNRAPITNVHDYNRDSFVDGTDLSIPRDNNTNFLTALRLLAAPAAAVGPGNAAPSVPPARAGRSPTAPASVAAPTPLRRADSRPSPTREPFSLFGRRLIGTAAASIEVPQGVLRAAPDRRVWD